MSGSSRLRFSLTVPLLGALALVTGIGVGIGSEAAQQKTFVYVNDHSGDETQMFGFQMDNKGPHSASGVPFYQRRRQHHPLPGQL